MQLGTRWLFGTNPPERIPSDVKAAISSVEDDVRSVGTDAESWRWTLTWLENRPVCELDDGTLVTVDANGIIAVTEPD